MKAMLFCLLFLFNLPLFAAIDDADWALLSEQWLADFKSMALPKWKLSYAQNLSAIQTKAVLTQQKQHLKNIETGLNAVKFADLSPEQKLDYDLVEYELTLNKQRIELENHWLDNKPPKISDQGLQAQPRGTDWYAYYLKRWVDIEATPNDMYTFGLAEVERIDAHMKRLQKTSGLNREKFTNHINSKLFFINDAETVQRSFEIAARRIDKQLPKYFPYLDLVPELKITRGTNKELAQTPAYYRDLTLWYNIFDVPYNRRQVEWIYIHEASPGHHYQSNIENNMPHSKFQKMFRYFGYLEGWAAYVEDIAYEQGFYSDIYDELGKWEWDIIRSVRVVLDVGINYYGWDDEKALNYWQQYISGKDDIAAREIARMKRWPAQVITYKYGAMKFLSWKAVREQAEDFSLLTFHRDILKHGSMPLSILEKEMRLGISNLDL